MVLRLTRTTAQPVGESAMVRILYPLMGGASTDYLRRLGWRRGVEGGLALDVLACPRCGGRLRVIAIVQDPAVVRTLLAHGGRARAPAAPGPAPAAIG